MTEKHYKIYQLDSFPAKNWTEASFVYIGPEEDENEESLGYHELVADSLSGESASSAFDPDIDLDGIDEFSFGWFFWDADREVYIALGTELVDSIMRMVEKGIIKRS